MDKPEGYYTMRDLSKLTRVTQPYLNHLIYNKQLFAAPTHQINGKPRRYYNASEVLEIQSIMRAGKWGRKIKRPIRKGKK